MKTARSQSHKIMQLISASHNSLNQKQIIKQNSNQITAFSKFSYVSNRAGGDCD